MAKYPFSTYQEFRLFSQNLIWTSLVRDRRYSAIFSHLLAPWAMIFRLLRRLAAYSMSPRAKPDSPFGSTSVKLASTLSKASLGRAHASQCPQLLGWAPLCTCASNLAMSRPLTRRESGMPPGAGGSPAISGVATTGNRRASLYASPVSRMHERKAHGQKSTDRGYPLPDWRPTTLA